MSYKPTQTNGGYRHKTTKFYHNRLFVIAHGPQTGKLNGTSRICRVEQKAQAHLPRAGGLVHRCRIITPLTSKQALSRVYPP